MPSQRTTLLTGFAAIGCVAACALPAVAAGSVIAGVGGPLLGWWALAVALVATAGVAGVAILRRRRS